MQVRILGDDATDTFELLQGPARYLQEKGVTGIKLETLRRAADFEMRILEALKRGADIPEKGKEFLGGLYIKAHIYLANPAHVSDDPLAELTQPDAALVGVELVNLLISEFKKNPELGKQYASRPSPRLC